MGKNEFEFSEEERFKAYHRIMKAINSCLQPQQLDAVRSLLIQYKRLFKLNESSGDVLILNNQINFKEKEIGWNIL